MSNMDLRKKNTKINFSKFWNSSARPRTPYAPSFLPVALLLPTIHSPQPQSKRLRATHKSDHSLSAAFASALPMSIREALVAWRKALSSAPNNKAHLKTLSQLYAKAVSDETKEATRKSPSPLKPSPPQSMIDANHSKAQAAVDRIVANRAEQTKKASEVSCSSRR